MKMRIFQEKTPPGKQDNIIPFPGSFDPTPKEDALLWQAYVDVAESQAEIKNLTKEYIDLHMKEIYEAVERGVSFADLFPALENFRKELQGVV